MVLQDQLNAQELVELGTPRLVKQKTCIKSRTIETHDRSKLMDSRASETHPNRIRTQVKLSNNHNICVSQYPRFYKEKTRLLLSKPFVGFVHLGNPGVISKYAASSGLDLDCINTFQSHAYEI